jgi:gamma-tubulin complex component 5
MLQQYLLALTDHTHFADHTPSGGRTSVDDWTELQSMAGRLTNTPVHVIIQNCLYPHILEVCKKASGCLVRILHTEFNLLDHFRTVQLILLMEAGDTMHHFASDIFSRIQRGERWRDVLYLNSLLQEVLLPHYPHLEKLWSVQVECEDTEESGVDLLSSITSLSLHYQVPWPVTTVFPPPLMRRYNDIFHFLLQVKWAKWSLETLQVKGHLREATARPSLSLLLHQLLLLRARFLHCVNSLYHYLMTRILHSIGLQFQGQVREARDLDSVLRLHGDYVSTIFDRCLLNKKALIVKEAVLKTLRLTLGFRKKWDRGLYNFSGADGQKMESEFSKCSHFLVTCLNNTVKRGSFPYLESLAFSLSSLKTNQRIFLN